MRVSDKGLNIIKKYEGLRLTAYKCPAGVWTIGYGHTAGVSQGMRCTVAEAEAYLLADVASAEKAVQKYDTYYNFDQNEFDALVSFTYNCGSGNLKKLTSNGKRTREEISNHITAYNKAGGKTLAGLVARRAEEKALFDNKISDAPYYFPRYDGNFAALDDILYSIGATDYYDVSKSKRYQQRVPIARANGIQNYTGSYAQNLKLIKLAREGRLRKP